MQDIKQPKQVYQLSIREYQAYNRHEQ